jgi:hypothetical protein
MPPGSRVDVAPVLGRWPGYKTSRSQRPLPCPSRAADPLREPLACSSIYARPVVRGKPVSARATDHGA